MNAGKEVMSILKNIDKTILKLTKNQLIFSEINLWKNSQSNNIPPPFITQCLSIQTCQTLLVANNFYSLSIATSYNLLIPAEPDIFNTPERSEVRVAVYSFLPI